MLPFAPSVSSLTPIALTLRKLADAASEREIPPAVRRRRALAGCVYAELRGERGYFGLLAVDPQRQRCGIGARLIAAAEEHCRAAGCRFMDLTFVNLRQELPGYYRSLGYVENGTLALPGRSGPQAARPSRADVEGTVGSASPQHPPLRAKKGRAEARPSFRRNKFHKQQRSAGQTQSPTQRPKPADCIDCREMSAVDAIPCIRSLNSSAFEALSRAVS